MYKIKLIIFDYFLDETEINNKNKFYQSINQESNILKDNNIKTGILTQKETLENENLILINFGNKLENLEILCKNLKIDLENEVAYMGEDLEIINNVKLTCWTQNYKNKNNIYSFISEKETIEEIVMDFSNFILKKNNQKIVNQIKEECIYQLDNIDFNDINKIRKKIIEVNKTNNIYFTGIGKSENIAIQTCNLLKSLSFKCFYLNATNTTHGDIGTLRENDLLLLYSKSGNTRELIDIIPYLKIKKVLIYGICCNYESKFSELCDETIILPFKKEIDCNINSIPTNSYMSFLFFTNILASNLSEYLSIGNYRYNHPAGNIGKELVKIGDILVYDFPKIIFQEKIELHEILLKMTQYKIGCCFFVDENDILIGLLTDGDIRRKLLEDRNIKYIRLEDINIDFYYENDKNKLLKECTLKKNIPFLIQKKIIGILN